MFTDKLLDVSNIIPKHSNNITDHDDAQDNWNYCDSIYGDFKFQLIKVNVNNCTVYAPPPSAFTELVTDYFRDKTHERMFFKTQWLLNEFILHGYMHPVQVVYNWKYDWFEVHPGLIRGAIFRLFNITEFLAFYHPMTDKKVDIVQEFNSVQHLLSTMNYTEYDRVFAKLVNYYDKPLYAFHILNDDIDKCAMRHKDIFYNNIKNGVNLISPVIPDVDYPIEFKSNVSGIPTIKMDAFDNDMFHVALYLLGTNIKYFNDLGIQYSNFN